MYQLLLLLPTWHGLRLLRLFCGYSTFFFLKFSGDPVILEIAQWLNILCFQLFSAELVEFDPMFFILAVSTEFVHTVFWNALWHAMAVLNRSFDPGR